MYGLPALVVLMDQALRETLRCFITMEGTNLPGRDPITRPPFQEGNVSKGDEENAVEHLELM